MASRPHSSARDARPTHICSQSLGGRQHDGTLDGPLAAAGGDEDIDDPTADKREERQGISCRKGDKPIGNHSRETGADHHAHNTGIKRELENNPPCAFHRFIESGNIAFMALAGVPAARAIACSPFLIKGLFAKACPVTNTSTICMEKVSKPQNPLPQCLPPEAAALMAAFRCVAIWELKQECHGNRRMC